METEEGRDVTAPSPAKRETADMFHEVKSQTQYILCQFVRCGMRHAPQGVISVLGQIVTMCAREERLERLDNFFPF